MGSTETEKTVVLKFSAWSNISYDYSFDTGLTREEWDDLSGKDQEDYYHEAIWNDIDGWDVDE